MPYDPTAMTEHDRSKLYTFMWIGYGANALLLVNFFVPLPITALAIAMGSVIGCLFYTIMIGKLDDYFASLLHRGMAWGFTLLTIWFTVQALALLSGASYEIGETLASGTANPKGDDRYVLPATFNDAHALALTVSFAYFSGFSFARIRGGT